jgi:hypothetical protein
MLKYVYQKETDLRKAIKQQNGGCYDKIIFFLDQGVPSAAYGAASLWVPGRRKIGPWGGK